MNSWYGIIRNRNDIVGVKFSKKRNQYENSTKSFVFDLNEFKAVSYRWWPFVRKVKGKVVFNAYRYSVSTAKHQDQARRILKDLKVKIDMTVHIREPLPTSMREIRKLEKESRAHDLCEAETKRLRRNERARERRAAKKAITLVAPQSRLQLVRA